MAALGLFVAFLVVLPIDNHAGYLSSVGVHVPDNATAVDLALAVKQALPLYRTAQYSGGLRTRWHGLAIFQQFT